ncbi:MAG: dinitrogenase iron-molybdenum cofactor biosynthesis protein [Spirochaetales bacterium]|nr:dinitrogenase iron-molybdenum cofactor biosynthesis protein [Spirochaetales bacterium]
MDNIQQGKNQSIYKVALASSDGKTIDRHYGKADTFYIFEIDENDGYNLIETRTVTPACMGGSHDAVLMEKSSVRFSDCRYVVAVRIGAGAAAALAKNGIAAMELPGSFDDAIAKLWKYNRIQNLFR